MLSNPHKFVGISGGTQQLIRTFMFRYEIEQDEMDNLIRAIIRDYQTKNSAAPKFRQLPRLFVDMDGTLCKWKAISSEEDLFTQGWFLDMEPVLPVVDAIRWIIQKPEVEVFILTAVPEGNPYARGEKLQWLGEYLMDMASDHVIFVPLGQKKYDFAPGGIQPTDILLDDYSKNLHEWAERAIGLKVKTDANGTKGTWSGATVDARSSALEIYNTIGAIIKEHYPNLF